MATLYIRNTIGELVPIPTIKGDPGVAPKIQDSALGHKTWWVYSNILNDYVDTGVRAEAILHIEDGVIIFTESSERVNIASGEAMSIVLGKIKKWLSDLKAISFSGSYDDLSNKPSIPSKVSDLTNDSGYQSADQVNAAISNLVNGSPAALDTLQELATALGNDPNFSTTILSLIGEKVAKIEGKSLSTNDFTDDYKANLDYDNGSLELTSVASIPSTKKRVYIEISANATLSFLEILQTGEQTVFIKNIGVASITVTLPSDASYVNTYGTSLVIPASSYAEVSRAYMKAGVNNIRAAV